MFSSVSFGLSAVCGTCLKAAGAGLDNSARIEAVGREPGERGLAEIVERGEAMLPGWTDVDVRAVGIAVPEQRKPFEDRRGRDAVESRKHSTLTEDTDIVERCLDSSEHDANSGFGLVHRCLLPDAFWLGRGAGRERPPPPAFEWASLGIYYLSEMREALFDTIGHFFCEEKGAANATPTQRVVFCMGGSSCLGNCGLVRGSSNPSPGQCPS